jgi:UDP-N-acetylglucosamine transferase subunit ALG13
MIFVTVGTPQQPFDRLVKAADDFAALTDEEVIIQAGAATYTPQSAHSFRWASSQEMECLTSQARVVITQASAGAIILAAKYGKPLIVAPRLSKYAEHYNDHQVQLAGVLQAGGHAQVVEELTPETLQTAVSLAPEQAAIPSTRPQLIAGLKAQLAAWQQARGNP